MALQDRSVISGGVKSMETQFKVNNKINKKNKNLRRKTEKFHCYF